MKSALLILLAATTAGRAAMSDLSALEKTIRSSWDFHAPYVSEVRFGAMADSLKDDPAAALLLRTQVARAQGLQMNYDQADTTLDLVDKDFASVSLPDADALHLKARIAIERGRVLNSRGEAGKARPLFEEALALADSARQEALAVDAAHMVALAAFNDSAKDDAIAWNERALAMAEKAQDPEARRWRGSLLNNLAWSYHDRKDYKKALPLFERALAARREDGGDDRSIREARWMVARCQRSLGQYDVALKEQLALEAECAKAQQPDGYVYEELGELYYAKGKKAEAKPWFAKAYAELSSDPYVRYNETARLDRLKELSGTTP